MAVTAVFLKGIRVVLEYGMLLWLLWFTVTLARRLFGDVRKKAAAIREPETKPREAVVSVLEAPEPELAGKRFAFGEQLMGWTRARQSHRDPGGLRVAPSCADLSSWQSVCHRGSRQHQPYVCERSNPGGQGVSAPW